jgi:hypothetical protein
MLDESMVGVRGMGSDQPGSSKSQEDATAGEEKGQRTPEETGRWNRSLAKHERDRQVRNHDSPQHTDPDKENPNCTCDKWNMSCFEDSWDTWAEHSGYCARCEAWEETGCTVHTRASADG